MVILPPSESELKEFLPQLTTQIRLLAAPTSGERVHCPDCASETTFRWLGSCPGAKQPEFRDDGQSRPEWKEFAQLKRSHQELLEAYVSARREFLDACHRWQVDMAVCDNCATVINPRVWLRLVGDPPEVSVDGRLCRRKSTQALIEELYGARDGQPSWIDQLSA